MANDAPPPGGADEPTIGQLVASASRDMSTIVRTEIALAKSEITGGLKHAGKGTGMFAGAAFFGLFGLGFLLTALAWGLLATWLAFLIVAVLLFIGAAILALVGKSAMAHADPTPTRAISAAQQTIATIKGQV